MSYPEHVPRQDDPHYRDFEAYRRRTIPTARCAIGAHRNDFSECAGVLELHHSHIEFALQNSIDLRWLESDYPGVSDPNSVGAWVESAENLEWLCVLPGTPVLMGNGTTKAIEDIGPGESVVTHNGSCGLVGAASRKRYRGEAIRFGGAAFTPSHQILTRRGWLSAAQIARQVWVHGPQMVPLRCEQQQVFSGVVGAVSVVVVDTLSGEQFTTDNLLHNPAMLHNEDELIPFADRHSHVSSWGDMSLADHDERAVLPSVQARDTTSVGAVQVRARAPMWGAVELAAAREARYEMCWAATVPTTVLFNGWVHDLSLSHNHSFIAGGIAAHNCEWHHRGAGGVHTLSVSDGEGVKYVRGLVR